MGDAFRENLDLRTASGEEVARAMTKGVIDALRAHKLAGNPVVVWDRGRDEIVIVPADEIVVPDEAAAPEPVAAELSSGTGRE